MKELLGLLLIIFGVRVAKRYNYRKSNYRKESGTKYKEIKRDKGKKGEYLIFKELEKIKGDNKILANLYLPSKDGTTEVDIIFIHESGVFVIESKNYKGWIFGSENNKFWIQVFKFGKKEKFYNPIWQNNSHVRAVCDVLKIQKHCIKSVIVFGDQCSLRDINVTSDNVYVTQTCIINSEIQSYINKSNVKFTKEKINEMYEQLRKYSNVGIGVKIAHIQNVKNKY